jgi:hypothetical protein
MEIKELLHTPEVFQLFIHCVKQGKLEMIRELVSMGLDPRTGCDVALNEAVSYGKFNVVEYLLEMGCSPASQEYDVLKTSIYCGRDEITRYLYSHLTSEQKYYFRQINHKISKIVNQ